MGQEVREKRNMENMRIDPEKLKAFACQVFQALEVPGKDSETVAENLVEAELRGVKSHGIAKLKGYAKNLETGVFNHKPQIRIIKEQASILSLDADYGLGAVAGKKAMEICLQKARETGLAFSTVSKGSHFGMAAFYSMMAIERNMIGIALCNSGEIMTVFGGTSRALGTNPISIAVPSGKCFPLVFDAATSQAAYNKIVIADIEGRDIPGGWALDKFGKPTTKAGEALEGAVIPFGGYKGSGLAIMVQVFTGILSGAFLDSPAGKEQKGEHSHHVGFFFGAVDIERFLDVDVFKSGIDDLIAGLKEARRDENTERIYMPGELEYLRKEENLRLGIEIKGNVIKELKEVQREYGITYEIEDCFIGG